MFCVSVFVERNGFGAKIFNDDEEGCCCCCCFAESGTGDGEYIGFCGDGVRLRSVVGPDTTVWELSSSISDKRMKI